MSGINSNVWRRSVNRSQRAHLITEERPHTVTDLKIIEADRAETVLDVGTRIREDRHLGTSNTPSFFCSRYCVFIVFKKLVKMM